MKNSFQLFFIASLLCASVFGQIQFAGNVTINNENGEFDFRSTSLLAFGLLGFNGVNYASVSVSADQNSANANGVFGALYTALGRPPSSYLAFFDIAANFNFGSNSVDADVTASGALIGSAYLSLEEVRPDGTVANTIALSSLVFTLDLAASSLGNGGLRFAVLRGTNLVANFEVVITFVVSDVVGQLDVAGNPIITPKSTEIIIEIKNFPYADVANSVRLNIGVATGQASLIADGLVSGSGLNSAYIQLSKVALVNGVENGVSLSSFTDVSANIALDNPDLQAQINAKFGANAVFKLVSVTFPAGASSIVYDPSVGVGSIPSSSSLILPSLLLSFFAFLFLLA